MKGGRSLAAMPKTVEFGGSLTVREMLGGRVAQASKIVATSQRTVIVSGISAKERSSLSRLTLFSLL